MIVHFKTIKSFLILLIILLTKLRLRIKIINKAVEENFAILNHEENLKSQNAKEKEKSLIEELKKNQKNSKVRFTTYKDRPHCKQVIDYKGPVNQNNDFQDYLYDSENSSENQDLSNYFDDIHSDILENSVHDTNKSDRLHKNQIHKISESTSRNFYDVDNTTNSRPKVEEQKLELNISIKSHRSNAYNKSFAIKDFEENKRSINQAQYDNFFKTKKRNSNAKKQRLNQLNNSSKYPQYKNKNHALKKYGSKYHNLDRRHQNDVIYKNKILQDKVMGTTQIKDFEKQRPQTARIYHKMKRNQISSDKPINHSLAATINKSDLKSEPFEVVSNQQVAKANSISKKEVRKAIDKLYKNYENEEDLNTDFKSSSSYDYASRLNQERKKNQLEYKELQQKIRKDRQAEEKERWKNFENFKREQLEIKNAFKNTVHMINHAQSCLQLKNYAEAKTFLEMAMQEDEDHSYAAFYKEAIRMIKSGQNKYHNFGAIKDKLST